MGDRHDTKTNRNELTSALKNFQLIPNWDSPLRELGHELTGPAGKYGRGTQFDESWRSALEGLAQPSYMVSILTAGPAQTKVATYTQDRESDAFTGCWAEDENILIQRNVRWIELANIVDSVLMAKNITVCDPLRMELSLPGFIALGACVDEMKYRFFQSMMNRDVGFDLSLTEESLARQIQQGYESDDARWLVSLFNLLVPFRMPDAGAVLEYGMPELSSNGLTQETDQGWECQDPLARLSTYWRYPFPAIAAGSIEFGGERQAQRRHVIAIRGMGPVWIVQLVEQKPKHTSFAFQSVPGAQAGRRVIELLGFESPAHGGKSDREKMIQGEGAARRSKEVPSPRQPPLRRSETGHTPPPAERVPETICDHCGKPLKQGAKFCTACGVRIAQPSPLPPSRPARKTTCDHCGKPLKQGAKFCTACGARTTD